MKIISLGLGLQSTAIYCMSSIGELPRADYAIFADPGKEKTDTYLYLEYLRKWSEGNNGIPIIENRDRNLYADLIEKTNSTKNRFASIPAFTLNDDGSRGMLRRQCTNEYKIVPVYQTIRRLYGLQPYKRTPETEIWHGITLDEIERMATPKHSWQINCYPLTGFKVTRGNSFEKLVWGIPKYRSALHDWYNTNSIKIPPKSACVFCPYQSDRSWADLKKNNRTDFEHAVAVDRAIRDSTKKGIKNPTYLHESMKPLDQINFNVQSEIEWGECSGHCHT